MREYHILNLGGGVQSTTIYLMSMDAEFDFRIDYAVFADVGEEPQSVYDHIEWLKSLRGPEIITVTRGKLGDDLVNGVDSNGRRFASIPAFTSNRRGERQGMVPRQCTRDYKVEPIEKWIRYELVGLEPGQRMPADVRITQYFGFSYDEPGRAARAKNRFKQIHWGEVRFPLIEDEFRMTRLHCIQYLEENYPDRPVARSACVFCPYKSNQEWRLLRDTDPEGWERACEVDEKMRHEDSVCNNGMNQKLYVHNSCVPLREAPLGDDQLTLFDMECEGGCRL